jgi:hypothetical protein
MTTHALAPRLRLTAWLGLGVAILAPVVVVAIPSQTAGLVAVIVFACAAAGCGVMCWIDAGDGAAQAGLIVVTSLAGFALASTALIWLHAWTPSLLWLVGAATAASCLSRLITPARLP